jgi:hypothetical protein
MIQTSIILFNSVEENTKKKAENLNFPFLFFEFLVRNVEAYFFPFSSRDGLGAECNSSSGKIIRTKFYLNFITDKNFNKVFSDFSTNSC